uniref:Uncharacterized protein n=1 Tax=Isometrus maculatus TaxID=497827 RepID=A0A0U1TYA8_ISOMC|nr:hypothetical protein [Isometrus maculatus]
MMSSRLLSFISVILVSNFLLYSCQSDCIEDFFECLPQNDTMQSFVTAVQKCCIQTLNVTEMFSDTFWNCTVNDLFPVVMNCINEDKEDCEETLLKYFHETKQNYSNFRNQSMSRIQRPTTPDQCGDSFVTALQQADLEQCENNADEVMDPLCKCLLQEH